MQPHKTPKWIRDILRERKAERRAKKHEERRAKGVTRTYYILSISCDCCSDLLARTNISRYIYGPRCPMCRKPLGLMQWDVLGTVQAIGELEAVQVWKAESMKKRKFHWWQCFCGVMLDRTRSDEPKLCSHCGARYPNARFDYWGYGTEPIEPKSKK